MRVTGKVCVITGGASGIGKALAERFHAEGAKGIVVADLQEDALKQVAASVNGLAVVTNVANEDDIKALVAAAEKEYGHIDVFVSNAGIARMGGVETSDENWQLNWDIHVMAHVYAARAVAEKMAVRGEGYLINTASAAGLLDVCEFGDLCRHQECRRRLCRMAGDQLWRPWCSRIRTGSSGCPDCHDLGP